MNIHINISINSLKTIILPIHSKDTLFNEFLVLPYFRNKLALFLNRSR